MRPAARLSSTGRTIWRTIPSGDPDHHWAQSATVDKSIVLGFKSRYMRAEIPNRYVSDYVNRFPQKLIGFAGIDPTERGETEQIFFGATVTYETQSGEENTISIVGLDEVDLSLGRVSWISPIAKALLRKSPGDRVRLTTPGGEEEIEVIAVRYDALP